AGFQMRLVLRGRAVFQELGQLLLQLCTSHTTSLPNTALRPFLTAFRPFRLCSSSGTRATSYALCATVTCCCRSNNLLNWRSHYARTLPRRAARKLSGSPGATGRPRSATVAGRSIRLALNPRRRSLSWAFLPYLPWSPREKPPEGLSSAGASAQR